MAKKKAKRKTGTAVTTMAALEKSMAVHATGAKARINQPAGNNIGIRNGKFTYKKDIIGRSFRCIVVDFVHTNAWYDSAFDPDNLTPPACFAMSEDGEEMQAEKVSPDRQSDYCDGCPQNAWGSADLGDGKACKNQYRLAVMAPTKDDDPSETELAVLTLPPTTLKNWDAYVRALDEKLNRPPYGVVTEFTFDESANWEVLEMRIDKVIDDPALLTAVQGRVEGAITMLMEPYDVSGYMAPAKRKAKAKKKASKKKAKKKTSKKKATKKKAPKKKTGRRSRFS